MYKSEGFYGKIMEFSRPVWMGLFGCALILDSLLISWAFANQRWLLIVLFVVTAIAGGYWLLNQWNIDERTDRALDDASRQTVSLFFGLTISLGVASVLYAFLTDLDSAFYPVGATLVVCGVVLFYLQALLSVKYEGEMR
ncbi:MAG: hypothetical protein ACXAE3_15795 [Candidatus Kariarchaeaceae archaeon]|jgi:uncharacterized membrane protein